MSLAESSFEQLLRHAVADVVRQVLREELATLLPRPAPPPPAEPLYLTPPQAARIAVVNEKTLRRWVQDGALRGRRVGRLLRIARADLDAFMEGATRRKRSTKTADEVAASVFRRLRR